MSKVENVEAGFNDIFGAIFSYLEDENTKLYKRVKDSQFLKAAALAARAGNPIYFFQDFIYPINNLTEGLLNHEVSADERVHFLFMNSRFVENHFQRVIEQRDGAACCVDKSLYMMLSLAQWLLKDQRIEFDYSEKDTHYLPKTVFRTHEDIEEFFDSLIQLHCGNGDRYVELMNTKYAVQQEVK